MAALKRRSRVEGWALDVPAGDEIEAKSALQRLGDNNRLWIGALVLVLLVSLLVMHQTKHAKKETLDRPSLAPITGNYKDTDHSAFAADFVTKKVREGSVLEGRFVNDRKFMVVVAGDLNADDIEYISSMAAQRILKRFGHIVKIEAYQRSMSEGGDILRATTDWDLSRHGFIVTFIEKGK